MTRLILILFFFVFSFQSVAGESQDPDINQAISVIKSTYGDTVSVEQKAKTLIKFGTNPAVGSSGRFTLWYTGQDDANETYIADNLNTIDTISSSSTSDTGVVSIEGHTMSGGNRTFVVQTATLNGQNKVTLTTPLNRVTRVVHADQSSTDLVGEVYVYEDTTISAGKPTDTTKIHLTVPAGENQSQKASTSLSSQDYWVVTGFTAGYLEKTGSNVADIRIEVKEVGGVWKPKSNPVVVTTGGNSLRIYHPYIIVPTNSDVRLTAKSSTTGQEITGDIQGYLAKKLN